MCHYSVFATCSHRGHCSAERLHRLALMGLNTLFLKLKSFSNIHKMSKLMRLMFRFSIKKICKKTRIILRQAFTVTTVFISNYFKHIVCQTTTFEHNSDKIIFQNIIKTRKRLLLVLRAALKSVSVLFKL